MILSLLCYIFYTLFSRLIFAINFVVQPLAIANINYVYLNSTLVELNWKHTLVAHRNTIYQPNFLVRVHCIDIASICDNIAPLTKYQVINALHIRYFFLKTTVILIFILAMTLSN